MDSWLKSYQLLCLPGAGSTWPDTPMTRSNIHPTTPLRQSWPSMQETTSLFGVIPMRYATNIQSKTFLPFSSSIFFVLLNIFRGGGVSLNENKIFSMPSLPSILFSFLHHLWWIELFIRMASSTGRSWTGGRAWSPPTSSSGLRASTCSTSTSPSSLALAMAMIQVVLLRHNSRKWYTDNKLYYV